MAAKVCLCPGYQGQAVVCPTCRLPTAGAVKLEDAKDAKAAPAAAAAAAAAAPVLAAGAAGAGDGDINMALTPMTLTQDQRVQADAAAAVRVDPLAYGRVLTTLANTPEALAGLRANAAARRRQLQALLFEEELQLSAEQLQNLRKRVYYRGVHHNEELVLVPVMRTPHGLVHIPPQYVTVEHVRTCEYLLVYAASVDPMTSRAADGSTGAGWTCVDDVKIEMAANTDRPTVPVGLRFVLGGQYHLRYGGLSLELCRNLPRTVAMTVAKPEPAAGAAAAAGAGAVVVATD